MIFHYFTAGPSAISQRAHPLFPGGPLRYFPAGPSAISRRAPAGAGAPIRYFPAGARGRGLPRARARAPAGAGARGRGHGRQRAGARPPRIPKNMDYAEQTTAHTTPPYPRTQELI